MNLYAIPSVYRAWMQAVDMNEGEITPELEATLREIEDTLEAKADAVVALVREADAEAASCRSEASHFTARARMAEGRRDRLKALLLEAMAATGTPRVATPRFEVSLHTAAQPTIRWEGNGPVPEWAARVVVELDAARARTAYRAGADLAGFTVEFSKFLRIK